MLRSLLKDQRVRFALAGCTNTALDFITLNILVFVLGLATLTANIASVFVGITISYFLNHFFVFRYPGKASWIRFGEFFLVTGFSSLVLQSVIIWGFETLFQTSFGRSLLFIGTEAEKAFVAINIAKLVAVLVGLVWNFIMYRFIVFRRRTGPAPIIEDPNARPAALEYESTEKSEQTGA